MRHLLTFLLVIVCVSCSRQDQHPNLNITTHMKISGAPTSMPSGTVIRDTIVEKELPLGSTFPIGRMIWTVRVVPPNFHVEWRMCAIVGGDTAFHHEGDDSWFIPSSSQHEKNVSSPSQKLPWYTREFFNYDRDSIAVNHPARALSGMDHLMSRYLMEHGMTAPAASAAEFAFWEYYSTRPIIRFRFPEYPDGGDQRVFVYHPTIRWFLPVGLP